MKSFVTHANIERYERLLATEPDPRQRTLLQALLKAEREMLRKLEEAPSRLDEQAATKAKPAPEAPAIRPAHGPASS